MEQNLLLANIGGFAISAIGIFLYAYGLYKDELPFQGWRTTVGFLITMIGGLFAIVTSGALNV